MGHTLVESTYNQISFVAKMYGDYNKEYASHTFFHLFSLNIIFYNVSNKHFLFYNTMFNTF